LEAIQLPRESTLELALQEDDIACKAFLEREGGRHVEQRIKEDPHFGKP
jgi:hypothetical protein